MIRNILFSQLASEIRNCSHEWSSRLNDRYPKLCPRETNRHSWKAGGYPGNPTGSVVPGAAAVTTNDPSLPPPLPADVISRTFPRFNVLYYLTVWFTAGGSSENIKADTLGAGNRSSPFETIPYGLRGLKARSNLSICFLCQRTGRCRLFRPYDEPLKSILATISTMLLKNFVHRLVQFSGRVECNQAYTLSWREVLFCGRFVDAPLYVNRAALSLFPSRHDPNSTS